MSEGRRTSPEQPSGGPFAESYPPEELLGPLNPFELRNAPKLLYVRGRQELLRRTPRVSIIGAREASEAGLKRAGKLARFLVEQRAVIVSGLAKGIDTSAHRAAIEAGGDTIAVLGTPLNRVYPAQNVRLQEEIGLRYLLVSQFPPGTPPAPKVFAQRNRTMALLSDASVIVEAGESSGTRHQGWEALRLGRPLFIAKSLADAGPSWVREMLGYGAEVLEQSEDLLDFLPPATEDWQAVAGIAF